MKLISYVIIIAVSISSGLFGISESNAKSKKSAGNYKTYKGAKAIDGDTFRYKGSRYRVQQYDAPELGQPGSRKATNSLQNKIDSGNYEWKPVARDNYGRSIVKEKKK